MGFLTKALNWGRATLTARQRLMSLAACAAVVTMGGCDSLLDVELPGQVTEEALDDPRLAETLVLSAQGEFEDGLADYVLFPGIWFEEFEFANSDRNGALMAVRSPLAEEFTNGTWSAMQAPRQSAKRAVELIQGFPSGSVADKDFFVAKARLYEGYATQLLGEYFCEVTFDGGPSQTRIEAWEKAELLFTEAITLAASVTTGPRAGQAASVLNAAYVGRARTRLFLGDAAGVLSDAGSVSAGFVYRVERETTPGNRENGIFATNNQDATTIPHARYLDLTIEPGGLLTQGNGVADPRVVVVPVPGAGTRGGVHQLRVQQKFLGLDADIPIASWREAQLMIAEVSGGQTAVNIINALRASASDLAHVPANHPSLPLPQFSSTDPAEIAATVQEERKRELWMQGTRGGDMLRFGIPFSTVNESGLPMQPGTCLPIPLEERTSNPNLS